MNENDESDKVDMTDLEKEVLETSNEIFEEEIWNAQTKENMKDLSKRELAKTMFGLGFVMHQKVMDYNIKSMEEEMLKDPKLAKSLEKFKGKLREKDEL